MKGITFSTDEVAAIEEYMSIMAEDFIGDNLNYSGNKFASFVNSDSDMAAWGYGVFENGKPLMDTMYFVFLLVGHSVQVLMPAATLDVPADYVQLFQWALCAAQSADATTVFCTQSMGTDSTGEGGITQNAVTYIGLTTGTVATPSNTQEPVCLQKTDRLFRVAEREYYYPVSVDDEDEDYWHLAVSANGDVRSFDRTASTPDAREALGAVVFQSDMLRRDSSKALPYACSNFRRILNSLIAAPGNIKDSQHLMDSVHGLLCHVLESMGLKYENQASKVPCLTGGTMVLPTVHVKSDGRRLQKDVCIDLFADIRAWLSSGKVLPGFLSLDIDFALECNAAPFTITETGTVGAPSSTHSSRGVRQMNLM